MNKKSPRYSKTSLMVNNNNGHGAVRQAPPLVVELVGPAGAGKTTLGRALSHRCAGIRVAADIELRKMAHLIIFTRHVHTLLPLYFPHYQGGRGFTWEEVKHLVYLRAWPRVLRPPAANNDQVVLLDHGPIFKLATLNAFGPERLKGPDFATWWDATCAQWAATIDMIIWLDAANTKLANRINSRDQRHAVKGKSEQEASVFLARYRESYVQILARISAYGGPPLLHFDTSQVSVDKIAAEVLATIEPNEVRHASVYPY